MISPPDAHEAAPVPSPSPAEVNDPLPATPAIQPEKIQELDEKAPLTSKNTSVAAEVNYREYVDWFINHNLNIRAYAKEEYVCGQYTADMINDSESAGYMVYFAAVEFSDGTGHALVSFKSTIFGITSWYFFEPQTNNLMTPETLDQELNQNMGKKVLKVRIYGYFDDAGDSDPSTWQFTDLLYTKNYSQ